MATKELNMSLSQFTKAVDTKMGQIELKYFEMPSTDILSKKTR